MTALLESKQLCKSFVLGNDNEYTVLSDVNLSIQPGEFVSVMGPSGSGKSTLLYNISGMDRAKSGNVLFNGQDITALSEESLAKVRLTGMGFVFQHIHLLKNLSIFDNVVLPAYLARAESHDLINQRAEALMAQVGVAHLADNDITQASGGQLQRVGICRALINKPDILFGDEPTGALNSKAAAEIMDLLTDINNSGTTIMLVTHDVKVAARTERVIFMLDGQIVAEKHLGKPSANGAEAKEREERLASWLTELGF
ncbi:MAG: ABC transporter ATP-binding protein [Ardenticatenaceae bacterium]|nr:ABC transporter ATP-binding protein [Ardenticatenaceae bacterium]